MTRFRYLPFVLSLFFAVPAGAGTFSFEGLFTNDTDLQVIHFTLAQDTPGVELRTFSYGGGVNGAGHTILAGGFDTHLNLYLGDGSQMNPGTIGPCAGTPLTADPTTGICGDVYYPTTLSFPGGVWTAGSYTVVLSLDANAGVGNLQDGFFANVVLGLPSPSNFTCELAPLGFQSTAVFPTGNAFCDSVAAPTVQRDGHWALDIVHVDSATLVSDVPEPSTLGLGILGLAMLGFRFARLFVARHIV